MPDLPESRVTLEELLKLKRHEEPEPAFWDRFDRDFEQRRLQALIHDEDSEVVAIHRHGWLRQTGWTIGALAAAVAFAFVGLSRLGDANGLMAESMPDAPTAAMVASSADAQLDALSMGADAFSGKVERSFSQVAGVMRSNSEAQFVLDAIPSYHEPSHFQRVLANPAFRPVRRAGAEFAVDTLTTSGRPGAVFLVDRPSGQF